ncbi:AraC family transcriptional regulator [Tenacibaculum maritimum]|uniref:helix-turn-helix domain-containing protein n=1 Tax=Tenacibaculum maritimum TaxID=107401 RepID=UPI003876B3A0
MKTTMVNKGHQLKKLLEHQTTKNNCGLKTSVYQLESTYGEGNIISYYFDGLLINLIDANPKKEVSFTEKNNSNSLKFSLLTEGEKAIKISPIETNDFISIKENNGYFSYIDDIKRNFVFYKNQPVKEIKIEMHNYFIQKHQLHSFLSNDKIKDNSQKSVQQLTPKMEEIASELFLNTQKGLLKRIFLESKVLSLLHERLSFQNKDLKKSDSILKKIHRVEAIIQSNIHEQISIQQLSRKVLLNQYVLKTEFKKIFGTTIFSYTNSLRMKKSKQLLLHTKKPIYEIADIVGYKNPTHFTAAFKKNAQMTPKEFRKQEIISPNSLKTN